MTDYSDMLDAVEIPARLTSNVLISDADILKFYNEGGRQFADLTACIKDQWLTPILPATGPPSGVLTYQLIPDAANVFSKVTVNAGMTMYRYKIAQALWFETISIVNCTSRGDDTVLERASLKDIASKGYFNPACTANYPELFRTPFPTEFELWPIFTAVEFSLFIEGRRRWVEMDASTQTTCYLPVRFKDAPMHYARFMAGLTVRDYEFANTAYTAYKNDLAWAMDELYKEDMAGGLKRSIVQP
jgi:hypothetical protein